MTLSVEDPDTVDFICIWVISETDYCKDDSLTTPLLLKEKVTYSRKVIDSLKYSPHLWVDHPPLVSNWESRARKKQ